MPIVGLHIRYGNGNEKGIDLAFKYRTIKGPVEIHLRRMFSLVAQFALTKEWGDHYGVFVATDTRMVVHKIKELALHEPIFFVIPRTRFHMGTHYSMGT